MMTVGDFFDEENKLLKGNSYRYDCVHIQDLAGEIAHMGINCDNLPNAMKNFVKFINTNDGMNELVKASIIHFYIAYLHPYFDGNGRMARFVHLWYLVQQGFSNTLFIPFSSYIMKSVKKYYEAYTLIEENQKRANANASLQPIVAVVEDYFEGHLTSGIKPTIYPVGARFSGDLYQIAYTPGKKKEVIDFLRNLEYKVYGSEDFEYTFLEDDIKAMYTQDRQTATIYSIFAGMAIIISSLGLLGISLFDIRQRYREIAIRKVNGASAKDLYRLLFRKYITVLIIAFVLSLIHI